MKVVVATVVGVLAVFQVIGALWMYGKLGIDRPSWLGAPRRISGATAPCSRCSSPIIACSHWGWRRATADGYKVPPRAVIHGVLGCIFFGAIIVKVTAVRSKRAPGWFLPLQGA